MIKSTAASRAWVVVDTARDTYNVSGQFKLYPNGNGQENVSDPAGDTQAANNYDILSNGFKLRSSNTFTNGSGETYLFVAFAESPLKYSLAR